MKITGEELTDSESLEVSKLLHLISDLERLSDHCSNIAECVIEITHHTLGMHEYTRRVRIGNKVYDDTYRAYADKYKLS